MSEKLRARVLFWLKTEMGSGLPEFIGRWENLIPAEFLDLSFWGLLLELLSGIIASFERTAAFFCLSLLPNF
jgi:hypothetical protein